MRCLLCGKKLPLLRKLKDPEFCCEAHKQEYAQNQEKLALARLLDAQAQSQFTGSYLRKKEKGRKGDPTPVNDRLGEFRALPPGVEGTADGEKTRTVTAEWMDTPFLPALPRRERQWQRYRMPEAGGVELSELGAVPTAGRPRPIECEAGAAVDGEREGVARLAALRETGYWKQALRPEQAPWPEQAPRPEQAPQPEMDPSGGRVIERAAETPIPAPEQGAADWCAEWVSGWRGRRWELVQRAIIGQWVPLRTDWRPGALPRLCLDMESRVDAGRLPPGSEEAGLVRLKPLRARAPRLARLTRPVAPEADELTRTFPDPRLRVPETRLTGNRLERAPVVAMSLAQTVDGNRKPAEAREASVGARAACVQPQLQPRKASEILRSGGRVSLTLPAADSATARISPKPSALHPRVKPSPPVARTIPAIQFAPPEQRILVLRLYPNSAGEYPSWRRSMEEPTVEKEAPPAPIPPHAARPLCDWVPIIAQRLPIPYEFLYRDGGKKIETGSENLQAEESTAGAAPAGPRDHGRSLTAMRGLGGCATQMVRISLDGASPRQWHNTALPLLDTFETAPDMRLGVARLKTFAEWLPDYGDGLGGAKWGHHLRAALSTWERTRTVPKWGAVAVFLMLAGYAVWPVRKVKVEPARVVTEVTIPVEQPEIASAKPKKTKAGKPVVARTEQPEASPVIPPPPAVVKAGFWDSVQQQILRRAAVSLTDDFRNGLAEWEGAGNWALAWSYDAAGFVRTGTMALYAPSRGLTDYRMELLGQIERRSLGWVVRAADLQNYYAIKLTILSGGPQPEVALVRYPVIRGVPGSGKQTVLPMSVQENTVYKILTEVHGKDFSVSVQGQMVDSWSEPRLESGGIGLFSGKGEMARIRWVGVWHQYDTLGRLCAFLAPGGLPGKTQ